MEACLDFAEAVLKTFGFEEYRVELSMRDPNKAGEFVGKAEDWEKAESVLKNLLTSRGVSFKAIPGEGAFYGPKIDIKLVDVLGRLWQLSTVQFDFNLPARFELEYKGEDGEMHQPVMVHRALFGSVERFFGVLIEHYAGAFPLWLAPVQIGIVPISEKHVEYAATVKAKLEAAGLRVELDERNEKMNAKIREFTLQKVPVCAGDGRQGSSCGGRECEDTRQGRRRQCCTRRLYRASQKSYRFKDCRTLGLRTPGLPGGAPLTG